MATDVEALIRRSARLEVDDLDFETFRRQPLDPATLRCLRYMHDVEGHTACYLRDVLATRAHRDPEVTAFLACWGYEEHWHGEALAGVLRAHDETAGAPRLSEVRHHLPRYDAFRPLAFALASAVSSHMVTLSLTWGAVNEWTTQAAYGRLAAKAGHPVLGELLRRIMRQEGRHIDFYAMQARRRLEAGSGARRFTRGVLRRRWAPVGSGVMPPAEVAFLVGHLFGDHEGRAVAQRVDRMVGRLPGLGGLRLAEGAVDKLATASARRVTPAPASDPDPISASNTTTANQEHRHAC